MKNLNIVFITSTDLAEGTNYLERFKNLSARLKELGHNVQALLEHSNAKKIPTQFEDKQSTFFGVPVELVTGPKERPSGFTFYTNKLGAVRQLIKRIKELHEENPIDLLWINQSAAHLMYPLTRLATKLKVKTVQSYVEERTKGKGFQAELQYRDAQITDKKLAKKADQIVVTSYYLRNKYNAITQGKVPITLLPRSIEVSKWNCSNIVNYNEIPVLTFLGELNDQNFLTNILDVLEQLNTQGQKIHFTAISQSSHSKETEEWFLREAHQRAVNRQVEVISDVPLSELKHHLSKSDLLITARTEDMYHSGISSALLKLLATGRAVLCQDSPEVQNWFSDEKDVFFLDSNNNSENIKNKIEKALTDRELRTEIGLKAQKVVENYMERRVVQDLVEVLLNELFENKIKETTPSQ